MTTATLLPWVGKETESLFHRSFFRNRNAGKVATATGVCTKALTSSKDAEGLRLV